MGGSHTTKRQLLDLTLIAAVAAWGCDRRDESLDALGKAASMLSSHGNTTALRYLPHAPLLEIAEAARAAGVCDIVDLVHAVPLPTRTHRYEQLTPTELRALAAIAEHGSTTEVARALFIAPATVKKHLAAVYRKLQVNGRDEAILSASRMGLLNPH